MFILVIKNKEKLKPFIYSSVLIPVVYLTVHFSFFVYHPSFVEFLKHKKWMLAWFKGTPVKPGNIIRNIFTGKLLDTLDNLVINKEWSIFQPAIVSLSVLVNPIGRLSGFVILYLIYIVLLTGGQAKFLMPVYPIMAVLAVKNIIVIYSIISKWMRQKLIPSKAK